MNISQAIEEARQGKRISRIHWKHSDKFVFMKPSYDLDPVGPHITDPVIQLQALEKGIKVHETETLCMFLINQDVPTILKGWHPTPCDLLADDWVVRTYDEDAIRAQITRLRGITGQPGKRSKS